MTFNEILSLLFSNYKGELRKNRLDNKNLPLLLLTKLVASTLEKLVYMFIITMLSI